MMTTHTAPLKKSLVKTEFRYLGASKHCCHAGAHHQGVSHVITRSLSLSASWTVCGWCCGVCATHSPFVKKVSRKWFHIFCSDPLHPPNQLFGQSACRLHHPPASAAAAAVAFACCRKSAVLHRAEGSARDSLSSNFLQRQTKSAFRPKSSAWRPLTCSCNLCPCSRSRRGTRAWGRSSNPLPRCVVRPPSFAIINILKSPPPLFLHRLDF